MRYHSLDALRAAMMLLGVVFHISLTYGIFIVPGWSLKDSSTHWTFDLLASAIHVFRMPTFFVVSGFFTHLLVERGGMERMLVNRIRRVLLPLVVLIVPLGIAGGTAMRWGVLRFKADAGTAVVAGLLDIGRLRLITLGHLWFLYYLLIFCAVVGIFWAVGRVLPVTVVYETLLRVSGRVMRHPASVFILAAVTFGVLLKMDSRTLETFMHVWPLHKASLAGYFIFFAFGWILFAERESLRTFERFGTAFCLLSTPLLLLHYYAIRRAAAGRNTSEADSWRLLVAVAGALAVSFLVYGLIGLFGRYFKQPNRVIRYLSDSCYWLYLMHLPLVICLTAWMLPWNAPALLKALINMSVSVATLLFTYEHLVRRTVIGVFLNGRREQPAVSSRTLAATAGSSGSLISGIR
ncbi:MAG: acyltransferase family protein [Bryobacteraceae bacterium]|nr:acyltransferase family protein [Bryobacteraceae bacterium]